jgi:hypothetical protein
MSTIIQNDFFYLFCTGILEIQLVGVKCDIDVEIVELSDFVFGCSYVPELSG